ncbi:MAG: hypothetical protein RRY99_09495 [Flavobacterium sp.]
MKTRSMYKFEEELMIYFIYGNLYSLLRYRLEYSEAKVDRLKKLKHITI